MGTLGGRIDVMLQGESQREWNWFSSDADDAQNDFSLLFSQYISTVAMLNHLWLHFCCRVYSYRLRRRDDGLDSDTHSTRRMAIDDFDECSTGSSQ